MQPVEKIAWFWLRVNEDITRFSGALSADRTLTLPAGELFAANAGAMERLFGFVAATRPPESVIRRSLARQLNVRKQAAPAGSDDWGEGERELARPIVSAMARKLGYEL